MRTLTGKVSRRTLIDTGLRTLAMAEAGSLLGGNAFGSDSSIERSAVCIYLSGGSDGNNMVVPMAQYSNYAAARPKLAVSERSLLQSRPASMMAGLGFHPALSELKDLFEMRALSVVANVGRRRPVTLPGAAAAFEAKSLLTEEDPESNFVYPAGRIPSWTSTLSGDEVQWRASAFTGFPKFGKHDTDAIPASGMTVMSNRIHPGQGPQRAELQKALIAEVLNGMNNVRATFPQTGLGLELLQVAGFLRIAHKFNITRPVFQVSQSDYSSARDGAVDQNRLYYDLSTAMAAFYQATAETSMASRVTTYTTSETGRTLAENKLGGAEVGWGNNYFVMGGSVLGGDVFGQFPSYVLGGDDDASRTGIWRPTTSADEYSSVLARWMGLRVRELPRTRHAISGQTVSNLNFLTS